MIVRLFNGSIENSSTMSDLRKRKVETEDDKSSEKQTASGTESDHVRKHFTLFLVNMG